MKNKQKKIIIAEIVAPHGTKGEVKVKTHTSEPKNIKKYKPIYNEDGETIHIETIQTKKEMAIVKFTGINDRDEATKLRNKKLLVDRSTLPNDTKKDEFYVEDLIGLKVVNQEGEVVGEIVSAPNFGAGQLIEIKSKDSNHTYFLEFKTQTVPDINIEEGTATIIPPNEI